MPKNLIAKAFSPLAKKAVESAEANFGEGKGIAKKRFAVNFVLARTPMPLFLRVICENLLVEIIGLAVENSCKSLNKGLSAGSTP